ncbi:hypothetical protein [Dictyobacter arantiisoli]|nr:hypothetical protein [Dictyobacter arantiisoli]
MYQENAQRPKKPSALRRWSSILSLAAVLLVGSGVLAYSIHPASARYTTAPTTASIIAREQAQLQAEQEQHLGTKPLKKANIKAYADTAQACTNVGISDDTNTTAGNIDGGGRSYSLQALENTHIMDTAYSEDNLQFYWPYTTFTDCISNGQVLPVTDATTGDVSLGLLGSATNGAVAGNATITYDDNSTQIFSLGFSDWTLGGGKQTPSYGNTIAAAQLYRNTPQGQQNVKTYVFLVKVNLQTGKKVVSITMPKLTGAAQLHVFAWSTTVSNGVGPYNNVGSSDDAYTTPGNFDHSGNSYPTKTEPWSPDGQIGGEYPYPSGFIAPDVLGGAPDNYEAAGQTIPMDAQGKSHVALDFAGAASNGPSYGTAYVNYTDGTRQSFVLAFSDWTLNGGTQAPSFSNLPLWTFGYRNTPHGQQNVPLYLFSTGVKIQANKIVQSVTLPASTNQGQLHVFSMQLADEVYGDIGSTSDKAPLFGNLDGSNHSYSEDALVKANIPMGPITGVEKAFSFNGSIFNWSSSSDHYINSSVAAGQTRNYYAPTGITATELTFIGSATNGASSGTGTLLYTDGSTATYTLQFSDWCAAAPQFGNLVVASLPYRNSAFGQQNVKNYVYYAETPIDPTKTLQSFTLPQTTGGQMHIFVTGYRSGPYNNIGSDMDEDMQNIANLDGQNDGYSADALNAGGLAQGPVTFNGVHFNWHPDEYSTADNYQAIGQVVPVTPVAKAQTLAFLGASTGGTTTSGVTSIGASGLATIVYTDGTKQTFQLSLDDWVTATASTPVNNNRLVATAAYRLTPHGHQAIKTSVFYTDVALQAGKTIQSVILPNNNQMHIFAISTK